MHMSRYDLLIRNLDPDVIQEFKAWCIENGIRIAGRGSMFGPTISDIIRAHIKKDGESTKDKIARLRDVLDANVIPKRSYYAPANYIEAVVQKTLNIATISTIRTYAHWCGYEFEPRRKRYKIPERATPSSQSSLNGKTEFEPEPELDPEVEKILEVTLEHGLRVQQERAGSVSSTTPDQGARPGSSPGPRTSRSPAAGHKSGKVRASDPQHHPMPICPGCKMPVHSRQSSVEIKSKGEIWHDACFNERKGIK